MNVRRWFEDTLPDLLAAGANSGHAEPFLASGTAVGFEVREVGRWKVWGCPGTGRVLVQPWDGARLDCIVRCDGDTLELLMRGGIPAARAYATGRAQVEGDVGLLLRLRDALDSAPGLGRKVSR